jgi:hypothetical protein
LSLSVYSHMVSYLVYHISYIVIPAKAGIYNLPAFYY